MDIEGLPSFLLLSKLYKNLNYVPGGYLVLCMFPGLSVCKKNLEIRDQHQTRNLNVISQDKLPECP